MLILTRREGEAIVMGNDVVITVSEVRGNQVRLGIEAPRSLQIHRAEVYEQVVNENRAAMESFGRAADIIETPRPKDGQG